MADDKGGVGYYVEQPTHDKQPQRSARHQTSIPVGTIDASVLDAAVATIQGTPVDSVSTTWNCQAWVVEALDDLATAGLFQWNQEKRAEVVQKRQNWQ